MTEIAIPTAEAVAMRGRVGLLGQATAIEQARAVAEVQAAIIVAQQCPRNVPEAMRAMREACQQTGLAERAFYRYARGAGNTVSGESVHLARELARCWGNIQYGVQELRRDDDAGQSEMQAFAWDVQTNTRAAQIFIVPHARDTKKDGRKPLVDLRDIYENNANQGARRLREAIFAVLPVWFREEAKDRCHQTLESGGGKPLVSRIADAVQMYEGKGVTVAQLAAKQGRKPSDWTAQDVAQLGVIYKSIDRGEVLIADEFPELGVTGAEIAAQTTARSPAQRPPTAPPDEPKTQQEPPSTASQVPAAQPAGDGMTPDAGRSASAGNGSVAENAPGSPGATVLGVRDRPSPAAHSNPTPKQEAAPDEPDLDGDEDLFGRQAPQNMLIAVQAGFTDIGVRDRAVKLRMASQWLGREVFTLGTLNIADATRVLNELGLIKAQEPQSQEEPGGADNESH